MAISLPFKSLSDDLTTIRSRAVPAIAGLRGQDVVAKIGTGDSPKGEPRMRQVIRWYYNSIGTWETAEVWE